MAEDMIEKVKKLMYKPSKIRNIGTIAHIDHGKTTFSDSLIAQAGMISFNIAGQRRFLDTDDQEQERGITIWSANASMVHNWDGDDYLINLIDTPGHVDFGGDVTRALRAVDGAILLVDAVEGAMPQTETVLRQALKERVKPILFINKVDRLIKELKLTPEQMQEKFTRIITDVNVLIQKYAEKEYKDKWLVNVADGSVAFGSALEKWGTSIPYMKKTGISFTEIIEKTEQDKQSDLAEKSPLHQVVLNMIIKHLPSPIQAQEYRIPKIWSGDMDSEIGQSMKKVNVDGHLAGVVTKVTPDPHAGFIATARIFSGKVVKGTDVKMIGKRKTGRLQQVSVYKGPHRVQVDEVVAGNIVGLVGIPDAFSGETICEPDFLIEPFEQIKHIFEPVVTKALEPKNPRDLTKLINFLKKLGREDTTIRVKINQETGEYLVSGLGELHIDAKVERKLKEMGLEFRASPPIVVYRETLVKKSPEIEGKSPNKHNRFYFIIEPLERQYYEAMKEDTIPSTYDLKKKNQELIDDLKDLGMSADDVKNLELIYERNMLFNSCKGVQYLNEAMEMVKDGFKSIMDEGPLAREPCYGVKATLVDASLHEDPVHRGPGQVLPAIRHGVKVGMLLGEPSILEPKQIIRIDVPTENMGGAIKEVQNRRGQVLGMDEERGMTMIQSKLPVSEMFGFNSELKSATGGKGFYSLIDVIYEKLPKSLQDQTVIKVRKRKGLSEKIPGVES